ncbi:OmpA family protein [Nonlabens xiamenensis]|uniref:OmpA family protein n=1 Tax=Nonlabens xiamenensis TaxID=2341043 RepID=UPI000F61539A|nr:OmpA family protein [Nonlabens xiamenensis]
MNKCTSILTLLFILSMTTAQAQLFKNLKDKVNKKIKQTEKKIEDKVDRGVDDLLFGQDSVPADAGEDYPGMMSNDSSTSDAEGSMMSTGDAASSFQAYSTSDFTPGNRLVYFENFEQTAIGDFPSHWNTNAGAEVVSLSEVPGKWLRLGNGEKTLVAEPIAKQWQDDFTLEFDIIYDFPVDQYAFARHFDVILSDLDDPNAYISRPYKGKAYTYLRVGLGSGSGKGAILYKKTTNKQWDARALTPHPVLANKTAVAGAVNHISIVKKGERLKMYINKDKVLDIIKAIDPTVTYRTLRFASKISPADQHFYISNIKYACEVDIPQSLFDDGRYQAHGITFDTNSSKVQPQSYATIKTIAQAMEKTSRNYQLVGHTDQDGDAAMNLSLSRKRAEAVSQLLQEHFGIAAHRLSTEGVGSSQPLSNSQDATAKALNRRVEIIEL